MAHARQQIRAAITGLVTGLPTTGAHVFPSRVYPLHEDNLPGLTVYTLSEEVETDTMGRPRMQQRRLTVAVEIYVRAADNFDNALDAIAVEVESAVLADTDLGGLCNNLLLTNTQISLLSEGDKPVAMATLTFVTQYRVMETNPETLV